MTKEELYSKALELHKSGTQLGEAKAIYEKIIVDFPNSPESGSSKFQLTKLSNVSSQSSYAPQAKPVQNVISPLILTTTPSIDGYEIVKTIEIITAECVFGMNIFKDFMASISDVFGGRSKSTQNLLKQARKNCLNELKIEAAEVGANAVVGVKLDYSEFSGQGKSMLFLVASGTAVVIKKKEIVNSTL